MAARYVSTSVRRREDPALLMGRARFMGDLALPGLLTVAFLRSPHAHARIVEIDVREARALAGVEAVVTGQDLAATTRPIRAELSGGEYKETGWPALAHGKTRFVGEPVVAVVAGDRYRAEDALDAIRVEYAPLAAAVDAEAAMIAGAPRVHDELADNVLMRASYEKGEVDAALAGAEIRFTETFRQARCSASPMEGRGVMASLDHQDGTLTVWAGSQAPHMLRAGLAAALDMPESRLRVLCPAVGGGFGPKMHLYPEDVTVADLARR
ncbi:MAG TPA: molybdopterin cofactor-binding domain-containing protein, partial [Solirubrobacteraceae bacterium]